MFKELENKYHQHVENLKAAFDESKELGLSPSMPSYKHLSKETFENLFQVIDYLQPRMNYDHIVGACLYVHSNLKEAFKKIGVKSELVFGDVIVNGKPHMGCSLDALRAQLSEGISHAPQKVHCWLLLENGQFFDATLYRDLTGGKMAAEMYGFDKLGMDGNIFEYKPMLLGSEFILKTSPNPQLHI